MGKFLKKLPLFGLLLFLLIWSASILKCEFLTYRYGYQFETIYRENTMMGDIDYLKVLSYSNSTARVYYVSKNRAAGDILVFSKQNGEWKYDYWDWTVWSKTGSADNFVWPYIR